MKSSAIAKTQESGIYYQINIRSNDQQIFIDQHDYQYLLSLLKEYLPKNDMIDVLAYCLKINTFCFLIYELKENECSIFLSNILSNYNEYYFGRYQVRDLLSLADCINNVVNNDEIMDISRKIHKSSSDWMDCEYSSIRAYFYDDDPAWINKKHITNKYGSAEKYLNFLQDCK